MHVGPPCKEFTGMHVWPHCHGFRGMPGMLLLSWQLVVPIGVSPLMKLHQAAVLAHRICFSVVVVVPTD